MDWLKIAQAREQELIAELQQLLQIESVLDEEQATAEMPFGPGPKAALDFMLEQGAARGMVTKMWTIWRGILKWDKVKI